MSINASAGSNVIDLVAERPSCGEHFSDGEDEVAFHTEKHKIWQLRQNSPNFRILTYRQLNYPIVSRTVLAYFSGEASTSKICSSHLVACPPLR